MLESSSGPLAWPTAGSGDRVSQVPHRAPARGANPLSGHRPHSTQKASLTVANIKSQIKRIKTNEKARLRNQSVKSELKTYVRRVREAVEAGDKDISVSFLVRIWANGFRMLAKYFKL